MFSRTEQFQDARFPSDYHPQTTTKSFLDGCYHRQRLQPDPLGCMTTLTPPIFRIAVVRASGCINMRAKVRWSRWRWSSLGFTLFLQLQGFSYWSAVALLHPCCATLTPEVRPVTLNTWFDLNKIEKTSFVLKKVFVVLALCVFDGRNYSLGESWMDNACLQCTCLHPIGVGCCETWVLVHNSILLWRFLLAWKYYNKKRRKHWKHIFFTLLTT